MVFKQPKAPLMQMNIRTTLAIGLFVSCVLITIISITAWRSLDTLQYQVEQLIESAEVKTSLIYEMKITARERNMNMMMAILLDDVFLIDDHWMQFRKQGSDFLTAREKYIALGLNEIEEKALEKQRQVSVRSVELQYAIFDSVREGRKERALELIEEAFEYQKKVFVELDKMLVYQKNDNEKRIDFARQFQKESAKTVTVLSMSVIIMMVMMTLYITRRLTQQAQFIQNEALKFKALIEGSMDAVLVIDKRNVIDCNVNALQLFGVNSLKELNDAGLDYLSMFSDSLTENKKDIFGAINHAMVNVKIRYQWDFIDMEGHVFPADVEITGIELEGNNYVQMMIRDVTERENTQRKLREANENLEHKVAERTKELNQLNSKIADIARSAGMAEVASGVLHNVGNVLNSVNVSTSILRSNINSADCDNLKKLVVMLKSQKKNLADFLQNDERGKIIVPYLEKMSEKMSHDKDNQMREIDSLNDNVEHIKNIVSMQQSYTGSMGVVEKINACVLAEDAIKINMASMTRHGVTLIREFEADPEISIDKHKLMQILVNVLSNAKHACMNNTGEKKIIFGIHLQGSQVMFSIEDNGSGIEAADIERLFEFGFKKRKGGHGYGLHHSALMANDLRGQLKVMSDGPGKGARFEVYVPIL